MINRKLVFLAEHQSTINGNMPLRFLQPMVRIFENGIPNKQAVYRSTQRLSEAFEQVEGFEDIRLELEVVVYNINLGYNAWLVEQSEELKGYAYFVDSRGLSSGGAFDGVLGKSERGG